MRVTFALTTLACLQELDRCLLQVELIPRKDVDEILALIHKKQEKAILQRKKR